jgi:hypothetical protein
MLVLDALFDHIQQISSHVEIIGSLVQPVPVERRERVIAIWLGSTSNGRNPMFNGRRQPSRGGTSRMTRECQVRFCERLGVKFPGPTRQLSD